MSAIKREMEAGQRRNPIGMVLVLIVSVWCVGVLYVIASVSVFGAMYPLGRDILATWVYGLFFLDPYFPHRGKLDLPVALIHAFLLYKSCQWLWRHPPASE
jgi:hypothetical protein